MATSPALPARTLPRRRVAPAFLTAIALLLAFFGLIVMGILGAVFGLRPLFSGSYEPSAVARAEIPALYLRLYLAAGASYGVDPWILAAIGSVETHHGQSNAPGVHAGFNRHGCCAGPMQFSVVGSPSVWDTYAIDGDRDGDLSPYNPADAIPAAANFLRSHDAPADYHAALYAYNHAGWYVAQVLAKADQYRGAPLISPDELEAGPVRVSDLLHNPRIKLTPIQRLDLQSGLIDPRLIAALALIARQHSVVITALRSDHSEYTADGNLSNHAAGRAIDIGAVDREVCRGGRRGSCAELVRELAAVEGPLRATELIYCWDPDGRDDPRGFGRADHCDHIHWGLDP